MIGPASALLFPWCDVWDVGEIRRRLARRRCDGGVGEVPARRGLQGTPTGERLAPRDGVLLEARCADVVRWHVSRRWRRGDTRIASRRVDGVEIEETPARWVEVAFVTCTHLCRAARSNSGRPHMSVTVACAREPVSWRWGVTLAPRGRILVDPQQIEPRATRAGGSGPFGPPSLAAPRPRDSVAEAFGSFKSSYRGRTNHQRPGAPAHIPGPHFRATRHLLNLRDTTLHKKSGRRSPPPQSPSDWASTNIGT